VFLRKYCGARNVLGVAVQLCTLGWLGFVPVTTTRTSTSTAPHSVDIDDELAQLDADGYRPLRAPGSGAGSAAD
jgi:hypothetical protein